MSSDESSLSLGEDIKLSDDNNSCEFDIDNVDADIYGDHISNMNDIKLYSVDDISCDGSDCDDNGYESDNNENPGVWSKSKITIPDEVSCGFEWYDHDGINCGSSMSNIESCNCDDSGYDCDAEDRYNKCKHKHQQENLEIYKPKFKLDNPRLYLKLHCHMQLNSKLRDYLFPILNNNLYKQLMKELSKFSCNETHDDNSHIECHDNCNDYNNEYNCNNNN